jgi:hypothetical protein
MPPQPQQAPVGLLALLQNPQVMALLQWIQQSRQMADQNMIGRNWAPPLGTAFGMAGMRGPGTVNSMPPRAGGSLGEMGLRFPEATVQRHLETAPVIPKTAEPTAAVKAAEGLKGDAAEAMINELMGIQSPQGMVRLYRGEGPGPAGGVGRWFTTEHNAAQGYAGPGGRITSVEVPAEVANAARAKQGGYSAFPQYFLPPEYAALAKLFTGPVPRTGTK